MAMDCCMIHFSMHPAVRQTHATNIQLETARDRERHSKNRDNDRRYAHGPSASRERGEMLRRYEQGRLQPNMPRRATVKSKKRFFSEKTALLNQGKAFQRELTR